MTQCSFLAKLLATCMTLVALTSCMCGVALAQSGYHWTDRSYAYAQRFCNGTNIEYLRFTNDNDCANFTSQCVNAGCSGMAESNNTNWPEWGTGNCWAYYCSEPDTNTSHGCDPAYITYDLSPSGFHHVIASALVQSWWLFCADVDWPNYAVNVQSDNQIPSWSGVGCIAFWVRSNPDRWHSVYVGAGATGQYATFYAHTNDRCGEYNLAWLVGGTDFDHFEIYGPRIYSPSEEDRR